MANDRINMFGMPWGEWNNLAGLSDPYSALSAEQGVPPVVLENLDEEGNVSVSVPYKRAVAKSKEPAVVRKLKSGETAKAPEGGKTPPLKALLKQGKLKVVKGPKTRHAVRRALEKDRMGMMKTLMQKRKAAAAKGDSEAELASCREDAINFVGSQYDELAEAFLSAGGEFVEDFHECLDAVYLDILEEVDNEVLWEAFLTEKGLTLENFHQLMDEALVFEDRDEMESLLVLQGLFEDDKKKKTVGGEGSTSTSGGVSMKGFKSLAGGGHPAVGSGEGSIDWGKFGPGGKKPFVSVAKPAPKAKAAKTNEDVIPTVEEIFEELLWEDFLAERGITVDQFHMLMDEAIASGDPEEMAPLVALDEIFGIGKKKVDREKLKGFWKKAKEVQATHGIETTKAASNVGRQVGQAGAPGSKTFRKGGGTSIA